MQVVFNRVLKALHIPQQSRLPRVMLNAQPCPTLPDNTTLAHNSFFVEHTFNCQAGQFDERESKRSSFQLIVVEACVRCCHRDLILNELSITTTVSLSGALR